MFDSTRFHPPYCFVVLVVNPHNGFFAYLIRTFDSLTELIQKVRPHSLTKHLLIIIVIFIIYLFVNRKRVFILGPSHCYAFYGAALTTFSEYQTPLGNIPVDIKGTNNLPACVNDIIHMNSITNNWVSSLHLI